MDIFKSKLQRIDVLYLSASMVYEHYLRDNPNEQLVDVNFLGYIFDCNDQIKYKLDKNTHSRRFYKTMDEQDVPLAADDTDTYGNR